MASAIDCFGIDFDLDQCNLSPTHSRATVLIRLPALLCHQLMNGATGYRAHYAAGIDTGEEFNQSLIGAVAPILLEATRLYEDRFSRHFLGQSLMGPYSKFWFPSELSDPSAQDHLLSIREEIRWPRWVEYWQSKNRPRKGLLAPIIREEPSVLLNGTFIDEKGSAFDQKPGRSKELFEQGWT